MYKKELEQKNRFHEKWIKEYDKQIELYNEKITLYEKEAKIQQNLISEILSSKSWKVTKPLRDIVKGLKKF